MPTAARDVMTPKPHCATPDMTVRQLAAMFAEQGISGAPVVDTSGKLIGVVSRTDLFRRISEEGESVPAGYLFDLMHPGQPGTGPAGPEPLIIVADFMSDRPVTAKAEQSIREVARLMAERRVHRVVVVDEERRPVGIVTSLDLLAVFPEA